MEKEITIVELERQDAQLLPEREALSLANWANVTGTNQALALNAVTLGSSANAVAMQGIFVTQA
jgi:hypothetical protein